MGKMLLLLVAILFSTVTYADTPTSDGKVYDNGECYEQAPGKEKGEFPRWVPCGKPDDKGFNKLNCEGVNPYSGHRGIWLEDKSECLMDGFKHYYEDGHPVIERLVGTTNV